MRIKSYFAPSVQAAIALARKEFGDGVTLVTSHVASLDNRHLGEYEVVFAIEEIIETPASEPEKAPEILSALVVAETPAPAFSQLLQQALQTPPPMHQNLDDKLEQIHLSLVALGLESSLVRSFMTMLKAVLPGVPTPIAVEEEAVEETAAEEVMEEAEAPCVIEETVLDEPVLALEECPAPLMEAEAPVEGPVVLPAPAIIVEERPAPRPKITVIKSEAPLAKPEPVKSEPVKPEPVSASPSPRPFLSLFEVPRPESRFSAAELAFMSSVSSSKEQKA